MPVTRSWTVTVTITERPELARRVATLRKAAGADAAVISDEVLEFIAEHVGDDLDDQKAAVIRTAAFTSLTGEQVTVEGAAQILRDLIASQCPAAK